MRKKIFAVLIVAVVVTFASYNIHQLQRVNTISDLALANVEALAYSVGEGGIILYNCYEPWYYVCSYEGLTPFPGIRLGGY